MNNKIIVALDYDSLEKAEEIVKKLSPVIKIFKIGSELFTAAGPGSVEMVHAYKAEVFLDLKFHDIPNTVAKAVKAAARLRPKMLNIHAFGGTEMIKSAAGTIKGMPKARRPFLLAVTVLTSTSTEGLRNLGISRPAIKQVIYMAKTAKSAGADGVVCSPNEITAVRKTCGRNFIIVTPGVRPINTSAFDQKRIATPQKAIRQGADFIVIGRPITQAQDPLATAKEILDSLK